MIVRDTDHLRVLQDGGIAAERLKSKLMSYGHPVGTTIISFVENVDGRIGQLKKLPVERQVVFYGLLGKMIQFYNEMTVLPFDEPSLEKFKLLKSLRLKNIGTNDLKIAAIALQNGAFVLTANRRHFDLIVGLAAEDWIHDTQETTV